MRLLGILLVTIAVSPVFLAVYAEVRLFGSDSAADEQLVDRAIVLTCYGIPLIAIGMVLQIVAARNKRRRSADRLA